MNVAAQGAGGIGNAPTRKIRCDGGCGQMYKVQQLQRQDVVDDNGEVVSVVHICESCIREALRSLTIEDLEPFRRG